MPSYNPSEKKKREDKSDATTTGTGGADTNVHILFVHVRERGLQTQMIY